MPIYVPIFYSLRKSWGCVLTQASLSNHFDTDANLTVAFFAWLMILFDPKPHSVSDRAILTHIWGVLSATSIEYL